MVYYQTNLRFNPSNRYHSRNENSVGHKGNQNSNFQTHQKFLIYSCSFVYPSVFSHNYIHLSIPIEVTNRFWWFRMKRSIIVLTSFYMCKIRYDSFLIFYDFSICFLLKFDPNYYSLVCRSNKN